MTPMFDEQTDSLIEEPETKRPGLFTMLILLLLISALLASMLWPLLRYSIIRYTFPPTPTPQLLKTV